MELDVRLDEALAGTVGGVRAPIVDQRGGLEDAQPRRGLAAEGGAGELRPDPVVRLGQPADAVAACPFRAEKPGFQRFLHQPGDVRLVVCLHVHHLFTVTCYLFVKLVPVFGGRGEPASAWCVQTMPRSAGESVPANAASLAHARERTQSPQGRKRRNRRNRRNW